MTGPLTILDAAKCATAPIDKGILMAAAMAGAGEWVAYRRGNPTRMCERLMDLKRTCRSADDVRRGIELICCCPYCGGPIPTKPTCPNCGALREEMTA